MASIERGIEVGSERICVGFTADAEKQHLGCEQALAYNQQGEFIMFTRNRYDGTDKKMACMH